MDNNNAIQDASAGQQLPEGIKPDVLSYDDLCEMAPWFKGKPKLVSTLMHWLDVDDVNWIHRHNCANPGVPFVRGLLRDLEVTLNVRGQEVLDNLPQGGFVTVSNHPFGALDGIMLIKLIGEHRPDFKVMVNMILNYITAMRPNFIAVDALQSDDPAKRAVSVRGIAAALRHVKGGHPLGFFPAGAVSKFTSKLHIEDRDWQPTIMELIQRLQVPVVPIYFHGHNSVLFQVLGMIDWRLRTLRLPGEVFRRKGDTFRISVGQPVMPADYARFKGDAAALGQFLKDKTYSMRHWNEPLQ